MSFDATAKRLLCFYEASDLSEVPELPGIYAWFLPLRGDTSDDFLTFLKSLESGVEKMAELTNIEGQTGQLRVSVRRDNPVLSDAGEHISVEDLSPRKLQQIASMLLFCSFLTAPIYVGMTDKSLRKRLQSHLLKPDLWDDEGWTGTFRNRVANRIGDTRFLERCLICCLPFDNTDFPKGTVRLFEKLLIRTLRPSQSLRGA